jgi:hypothetical protein
VPGTARFLPDRAFRRLYADQLSLLKAAADRHRHLRYTLHLAFSFSAIQPISFASSNKQQMRHTIQPISISVRSLQSRASLLLGVLCFVGGSARSAMDFKARETDCISAFRTCNHPIQERHAHQQMMQCARTSVLTFCTNALAVSSLTYPSCGAPGSLP